MHETPSEHKSMEVLLRSASKVDSVALMICGFAQDFNNVQTIIKGSGLGLATLSEIIRTQNGFIRLESIVRPGTVVSVCLPVNAERSFVG